MSNWIYFRNVVFTQRSCVVSNLLKKFRRKRTSHMCCIAAVSCSPRHHVELIHPWCCSITLSWSYMLVLRSWRKDMALQKGKYYFSLCSRIDWGISCYANAYLYKLRKKEMDNSLPFKKRNIGRKQQTFTESVFYLLWNFKKRVLLLSAQRNFLSELQIIWKHCK